MPNWELPRKANVPPFVPFATCSVLVSRGAGTMAASLKPSVLMCGASAGSNVVVIIESHASVRRVFFTKSSAQFLML